MTLRAILLSLAMVLPAQGALACGDPETPCPVTGGQYYAALPEDVVSPPALLWLHGYAASGKAFRSNPRVLEAVLSRGYAVIAPDGQPNPFQRSHLDWGVSDGVPLARDDIAFLQEVRADAIARFGSDPERVLVAGYSRGGGMAWDLACADPAFGFAFATHAGGFWEPLPGDCAGPIHLLHSHGFTDSTLPPEGSAMTFYGQNYTVGDIFAGLALWRETMGCPLNAQISIAAPDLWIKDWTSCAEGSLRLELLPGGHNRRPDWPGAAIDWADTLPRE